MGYDTEITMYILIVVGIYGLVKWIQHRPLAPDPWEGVSNLHDKNDVLTVDAVVIPTCKKCGMAVEEPDAVVCPNCGTPFGEVSRGMLFVHYFKRLKFIKAAQSLFLK